jgi:outer membrane lipoprotein-sorting protein
MSLTRRTLTLSLAAAALASPALAAIGPDDQALVDKATAYLQSLDEARGRFTQTDAQGRTTQGTFYLKRPGKARFEYDPPSGLVVVSDGAAVTVADSRLMTFNRYPLAATPLSLFLARTIRLDRGVAITAVDRLAGGFVITARDGKKKTAGQLALAFADSPLQLTGWTVTDAQGRTTRVKLQNLQRTSGLDRALFTPKDPRPPSARSRL